MEHQEYYQALFLMEKKGKKIRNILRCTKQVKDNTTSWQKAINDASITPPEIKQAHKFSRHYTCNSMIKKSDYFAERLNSTTN